MCILLSFGINVVALANEKTITPKYNNSRSVEYEFVIEDNVAQISVLVTGYENVTSNTSVNIKLEKRALWGLFWTDVEEWNDSTSNNVHRFSFSKPVSSGTYRCSFEVTVEGTGGSPDVLTKVITVKN